jgi:hypothetical protein
LISEAASNQKPSEYQLKQLSESRGSPQNGRKSLPVFQHMRINIQNTHRAQKLNTEITNNLIYKSTNQLNR